MSLEWQHSFILPHLYHTDYRIEILHGFHASFPQLKAIGKNIYWNPCSLKRKLVPLVSESLAVHSGNVMPPLAESACRLSGICSVPVGRVFFTRSGSVLYKIIDAPIIDGFFESQCVPYWENWIKNEEKNNKKEE